MSDRLYTTEARVRVGDTVKEVCFESRFPLTKKSLDKWMDNFVIDALTADDDVVGYETNEDGERVLIMGIGNALGFYDLMEKLGIKQ